MAGFLISIDLPPYCEKTAVMRAKLALFYAILLIFIPVTASASLDGKEDFSVPRIMAISSLEQMGNGPWANGSGYLYSPRIVFSAGHIKDNAEFSQLYVSQLNQELKESMQSVKVIKKYFPSTYSNKNFKDDFAILILEKPIAELDKAPLITPELLAKAIAAKTPMKITGYGIYQDICAARNVSSPCKFNGEITSLVPRSIEMTPWTASEMKSKYGRSDEEINDHIFLTGPYKSGACGGDSGGSTTVLIDGTSYYVGTTPSGHWNAFSCGQAGGAVGDTIGYTAPIFKFLEMIAEAERYIAENPYIAPAPLPTASASTAPTALPTASASTATSKPFIAAQYQYIYKLAQQWAKASKPSDTGMKQCSTARDKGVISKNGKAAAVGAQNKNLRTDLKKTSGFKACLAGFNS